MDKEKLEWELQDLEKEREILQHKLNQLAREQVKTRTYMQVVMDMIDDRKENEMTIEEILKQLDETRSGAIEFLSWALEWVTPPRPRDYHSEKDYREALDLFDANYKDTRTFLEKLLDDADEAEDWRV